MQKIKYNRGITLSVAILISSISLIVATGVANIVIKELSFSFTGRDSDVAFYAADSGAECGYYWDKNKAFDTVNYNITCGASNISGSLVVVPDTSSTTQFNLGFANGSCTKVIIVKTPPNKTTIESRGYNMDCDAHGEKKVERALRAVY